jgi:hypothetical protein
MSGEIIAFTPLPDSGEGFESAFTDDPGRWLPDSSTPAEGGAWTVNMTWGRHSAPMAIHVGSAMEADDVLSRELVASLVGHGQLSLRGVLELRTVSGSTSLVFRGTQTAEGDDTDRDIHGVEAQRDAYGVATRLLMLISRRLEALRDAGVASAMTRHPSGRSLALR